MGYDKISMKIKFILFIVFVGLLMNCSNKNSTDNNIGSDWQTFDVKLDTLLEIQEDSVPFIPYPEFIVSDSSGNIVIAERTQQKLFVFNNEGDFIHTIGEKGPGPAEFRSINGMTIDSNDVITVFDRSSQTFKNFRSSGEYINSEKIDSPVNIPEFGKWKNYRLMYYSTYNPNGKEKKLLHIFEGSKKVFEGISLDEMDGLGDDTGIPMIDVGSHMMTENDTLLFAPYFYNGFIYKYVINDSSSSAPSITFVDKQKGISHVQPIEKFKAESYDGYADIEFHQAGVGTSKILLLNQSKALFEIAEDTIAHVTYIEDSEATKRTFGIEYLRYFIKSDWIRENNGSQV